MNDGVGLRSGTAMRVDRLDQVHGATIVKKEQALSQTPQRSRAELIRSGPALVDSIRQVRTHVVQGEVGVGAVLNVGHAREDRLPRGQCWGVAESASDRAEQGCAVQS